MVPKWEQVGDSDRCHQWPSNHCVDAEGRARTELDPVSKSGPVRTGLGVGECAAWLRLSLPWDPGPLGSGLGVQVPGLAGQDI